MISELNERSREILRLVIDAYLETGEPVGSRTLSRRLSMNLSPATIRNAMADMEDAGLLFAPHTSAGRLPTNMGLKLFVDGLLELGNLTEDDRTSIDSRCAATGRSMEEVLEQASSALSGLSKCAGLVFAPKVEASLRHIEIVNLSPGRALVILVADTGVVENRVIETPPGVTPSMLTEASNFLSARLVGRTIDEARDEIVTELEAHQSQLNVLTARVVAAGLAEPSGEGSNGVLIVRGQANLLDDVTALADLEHIRKLFSLLEAKEAMLRILSLAEAAEGVQIFVGAENELFDLSGCSLIVGPYRNAQEKIVGAIGVIGPARMNYARIVPMVDYTANLIGRLIG